MRLTLRTINTVLLVVAFASIASIAFGRTRTERAYDHGFVDGRHFAKERLCHQKKILGTGTPRYRESAARKSAIKVWMKAVEAEYGKRAFTWEVSQEKEIRCYSAGADSWKTECTVEAYPCDL